MDSSGDSSSSSASWSASSKKLKLFMPSDNDSNDEKNSNSYYILIDSDIFKGILEELARYPACNSSNILFGNDKRFILLTYI